MLQGEGLNQVSHVSRCGSCGRWALQLVPLVRGLILIWLVLLSRCLRRRYLNTYFINLGIVKIVLRVSVFRRCSLCPLKSSSHSSPFPYAVRAHRSLSGRCTSCPPSLHLLLHLVPSLFSALIPQAFSFERPSSTSFEAFLGGVPRTLRLFNRHHDQKEDEACARTSHEARAESCEEGTAGSRTSCQSREYTSRA